MYSLFVAVIWGSLLVTTCLSTYDLHYNTSSYEHWFKAISDSTKVLKPYYEAKEWCNDTDGYMLATVLDEETQTLLENFLQTFELTSDHVWVGAERTKTGKWIWTDGVEYKITGSEFAKATDNLTGSYMYLQIEADVNVNLFADFPREINRKYICQYKGEQCTRHANKTGYRRTGSGDGCYVVYPHDNSRAHRSWYEARSKCLFEGGDLAGSTILRDASASWLHRGVLYSPVGYWIGLRQDQLMWINSDGHASVPLTYMHFLSSEPRDLGDDTCIAMSHSSQWAWTARNCSTNFLFVCHKVRSIAQTTTPEGSDGNATTTAATTTTDSSSLSTGTLIGIIVGCAAFYVISVILAFIIGCCCCGRKKSKTSQVKRMEPIPVPEQSSAINAYTDSWEMPAVTAPPSNRIYDDNQYTGGREHIESAYANANAIG